MLPILGEDGAYYWTEVEEDSPGATILSLISTEANRLGLPPTELLSSLGWSAQGLGPQRTVEDRLNYYLSQGMNLEGATSSLAQDIQQGSLDLETALSQQQLQESELTQPSPITSPEFTAFTDSMERLLTALETPQPTPNLELPDIPPLDTEPVRPEDALALVEARSRTYTGYPPYGY